MAMTLKEYIKILEERMEGYLEGSFEGLGGGINDVLYDELVRIVEESEKIDGTVSTV